MVDPIISRILSLSSVGITPSTSGHSSLGAMFDSALKFQQELLKPHDLRKIINMVNPSGNASTKGMSIEQAGAYATEKTINAAEAMGRFTLQATVMGGTFAAGINIVKGLGELPQKLGQG